MSPRRISGSPTFCRGGGEAVVASERRLEAAAERITVDRSNVRLIAPLDRGDDVAHALRLRGGFA